MTLKTFYVLSTLIIISVLCVKSCNDSEEIKMLNSDVNELRKVSYKNYEKYEEEKQSYSILLKKYEECSTKTAKKEAEIEEINSVCIRK